MRTRSQSRNNFPQQEASPVIVEPLRIELPFLEDQFPEDPPEDPPKVPMAANRTMAELLQAPTEGYEDAIVILEIAANNFELKYGLINLVQNKQFFGHHKEDPHARIRYFNKITSTGAARIWLEKEPPRCILTWDDLVTNFINHFFPPLKTTNLRNEITRFQQRFDESFYEAWDRFNDLLRACPHHGFSELHQLDTFFNALNVNEQDSLNSAAGGNFLDKMPHECLKIIESKSKVRQSQAKAVIAKVSTSSSTPAISSDVAELKDMVRALHLDKKNQSSAPAHSPTPALVKAVEPNCVTCGGAHSYQNCPATSENVYQDNIQNSQSTAPVQPPVVQSETQTLVSEPIVAPVIALMSNMKPSIPYPSRRDNERRRDQANEQIKKFYKIFKDMSFEISFTDALILMPKFASTLKALIGNKEKLIEMARTPMNEHSSTVILNKLPRKLRDPGKFLIPCEFPGMDECLALADLGASINLMPLSVWEGLSLPDLHDSRTCGSFDPRVPLVLGRCFLKTGRALIDMHKGELTLHIGNKAITYNLDQTSRYSANYNQMTANKIDVIDMACEEYSQEILAFSDVTTSGNPTPYDDMIVSTTLPTLTPFGDSDFLLFEEADAFLEDYKLAVQHQRRVNPKIYDVIKKEVEKLLDAGLIYPISDSPWVSPVHCVPKKGGFTVVENVENKLIPTRLVTGWRVCIDYRKLNEATCKDHFSLPFMDQMLERLAGNEYYCFLDGFFGYFQIPIDPHDQEKTTFTCPYETFSYRRMSFGIEVDKAKVDVIAKLPHPITVKGIEVDKAKVDVIAKLPHPITVNEAPVLIAPNWDLPFELMCDASDFAIGAVLGQRHEKHFRLIHYAGKTMTNAESNYTTTKKEMLAVDCPNCEVSRALSFFLHSQELHILSFILEIQYPNRIANVFLLAYFINGLRIT
nr:reverse transcriptase domain-containing protein [Tanacetum cinerariifolium]